MKGTSNTLDEVMAKNGRLSKEKEELLVETSECKKLIDEKVGEIMQLKENLREDKEKSERHLQQEVRLYKIFEVNFTSFHISVVSLCCAKAFLSRKSKWKYCIGTENLHTFKILDL